MNRLLLQQQTALSTRPALARRDEQPGPEGRGVDADSAPTRNISADQPATFAHALRRTQKKVDAEAPVEPESERGDGTAKAKHDESQERLPSADEAAAEGTAESEDLESTEDDSDTGVKEPEQVPVQVEATRKPETPPGPATLVLPQTALTTLKSSTVDQESSNAASADGGATSEVDAGTKNGVKSPRATPVVAAQTGPTPRGSSTVQATGPSAILAGAAPKPTENPEPGKQAHTVVPSGEAPKKIESKPAVAESDDGVNRELGTTKTIAAAPRGATPTNALPATQSGESTGVSAPNIAATTRRQVPNTIKNPPAAGAVKTRVTEHLEGDEAETGARPVEERVDASLPLFSAERDALTNAAAPSTTSPEVSSVVSAAISTSIPVSKPIVPDVAGTGAPSAPPQGLDRPSPEAATAFAPSAVHSMPRGLDLFARLSTEPLAAPAPAGAQGQANAPEFQRALQVQIQRGMEQAAAQAAASGAWAGGAAVGSGSVMLRLHPANLGLMRVYLRMDSGSGSGGGGVRARFEVSSSRTKGLLGGSIDSLRSALRDRGLTVDEVTVTEMARMPERDIGLPPVFGGIGEDGAAFAFGSNDGTSAGVAAGVEERAGGARAYVSPEFDGDGSGESQWERGGQPVVLAAVSRQDSPLSIDATGRVCVNAVV